VLASSPSERRKAEEDEVKRKMRVARVGTKGREGTPFSSSQASSPCSEFGLPWTRDGFSERQQWTHCRAHTGSRTRKLFCLRRVRA